jgi:hypothetical protein
MNYERSYFKKISEKDFDLIILLFIIAFVFIGIYLIILKDIIYVCLCFKDEN